SVPREARGGIADGTALPHRARHRRPGCKRSICPPGVSLTAALTSILGRQSARQRNEKFGKDARLCIYVDLAAVLFHHNVVTHGQAKPGSLACRLGSEEGIEHLLLHGLGDARAIVANANFNPVPETFGAGAQGRLEIAAAGLLALGGGIKSI